MQGRDWSNNVRDQKDLQLEAPSNALFISPDLKVQGRQVGWRPSAEKKRSTSERRYSEAREKS